MEERIIIFFYMIILPFNGRMIFYPKCGIIVAGNNEHNTITIADASVTKAEKEEHDIQVGSFVKLYIAPEKTVGSVKVVF